MSADLAWEGEEDMAPTSMDNSTPRPDLPPTLISYLVGSLPITLLPGTELSCSNACQGMHQWAILSISHTSNTVPVVSNTSGPSYP